MDKVLGGIAKRAIPMHVVRPMEPEHSLDEVPSGFVAVARRGCGRPDIPEEAAVVVVTHVQVSPIVDVAIVKTPGRRGLLAPGLRRSRTYA